jgi:hypothetical protein
MSNELTIPKDGVVSAWPADLGRALGEADEMEAR